MKLLLEDHLPYAVLALTTCEKLQELRNSRELTQEGLAEQLYISRTTI
jgi:DNA-binding XRE family transcriptional regulator